MHGGEPVDLNPDTGSSPARQFSRLLAYRSPNSPHVMILEIFKSRIAESNRVDLDYKSSAQPLCLCGVEPTGRIELPSCVYETRALPLSYEGVEMTAGLEPTMPILQNGAFATWLRHHWCKRRELNPQRSA